jgi:hypothetical protein
VACGIGEVEHEWVATLLVGPVDQADRDPERAAPERRGEAPPDLWLRVAEHLVQRRWGAEGR